MTGLFPPYCVKFSCHTTVWPQKFALSDEKIPSPLGIPLFIKQALVTRRCAKQVSGDYKIQLISLERLSQAKFFRNFRIHAGKQKNSPEEYLQSLGIPCRASCIPDYSVLFHSAHVLLLETPLGTGSTQPVIFQSLLGLGSVAAG